MHKQRVITGFVALPFLIYIILKGSVVFSVFLGAVSVVALYEYFTIVFNNTEQSVSHPVALTGFIITGLMIYAAHGSRLSLIPFIICLNILLTAAVVMVLFKNNTDILEVVYKETLGIVYAPLLLSFIVLIRHSSDNGATWIFFLLFLVFCEDIGAYYAGRRFGKHKLIPSVSPGKTIEGFLGGLAASMTVGVIFKLLFLPDLPLNQCFLMFLCIGIVAPLGDLFESIFKRVGGVKDSGKILPGHGGILDRVDALIFAAPILFLFKEYIF